MNAAHETTKANESLQRYKEEQRLLDVQADEAIAGAPRQGLSVPCRQDSTRSACTILPTTLLSRQQCSMKPPAFV